MKFDVYKNEKVMNVWIMVLSFLFLVPNVVSVETWYFDASAAQTYKEVLVNHEEQFVLPKGIKFKSNGKERLMENVAVFFSMDPNSQKAYLNRVLNTWKERYNITSIESAKMTNLINVWSKMCEGAASDQEVVNAVNELNQNASTPEVVDLLAMSGVSEEAMSAPKNKVELNETAIIMAGLWGGMIGGALVAIAGKIVDILSPAAVSKLTKSLMGYLVDAGVKIGTVIAKGISIGAQWIGQGLKKIFGKKSGKKGKSKSVIALPNGQGDCCGLPYPVF